jgi:hypothetical protein
MGEHRGALRREALIWMCLLRMPLMAYGDATVRLDLHPGPQAITSIAITVDDPVAFVHAVEST